MKQCIMKPLFIIVFCFFVLNTNAQILIRGKILDTKDNKILNANVILKKKYTKIIFRYTFTNEDGEYKISYPFALDSMEIVVSAIGYAEQEFLVASKSQVINFTLTEKITELPTVIVQQKPITTQGDTTNYNVASFSGKQDRVIGDVIAKLPGIEIDANGQIKYNGQTISHYYIDGMDMLGSKYNIANQNIPHNLVDQVQILNNHQPIRLLDSLNTSITPALNIKLNKKAKNKLINRAKVGAGVSPFLWDNALTTLRFNPSLQLITAYKNNNTGITLGNELGNNVSIVKVGEAAEQNKKETLLNISTFGKPAIAENKYLFNNTHLVHANVLKALKNKGQLKFNVSYLNEKVINNVDVITTFKLPSDTITLKENQQYKTTKQVLNNSVEYNVNTKKLFLKNTTKANILVQKEHNILKDTGTIAQELSNPFYEYSNDFALQIPIGKKIVSINSLINYNTTPQILAVTPGQFTSIFNQSIAYQKVIQQATLNNFNTNNSVSFLTKIKKWQQQIKVGNEYINKKINSFIEKEVNQTKYLLNDTFKNNMQWQNNRVYAEAKTVFQKKENQLEIELPIEVNSIHLKNKLSDKKTRVSKFFFNPKASLRIVANSFISFNLMYSKLNSFGSPLQTTQGYILTNYRGITKNDTIVPLNKQSVFSLSSFYKNPLRGIFGYATISYIHTKSNITFKQQYNNFFIQSIALPIDNIQKSIFATTNLSKYFLDAKTSIGINFTYSNVNFNQFIQSDLAEIGNILNRWQIKISNTKLKWINIESNTGHTISKSKIATNNRNQKFTPNYRLDQILKMFIYLKPNLILISNNELYYLKNATVRGNYLFNDLGLLYKLKKSSFEISCSNLFNTRGYINLTLANNYEQLLLQQMRPTNFLVKYYFNF